MASRSWRSNSTRPFSPDGLGSVGAGGGVRRDCAKENEAAMLAIRITTSGIRCKTNFSFIPVNPWRRLFQNRGRTGSSDRIGHIKTLEVLGEALRQVRSHAVISRLVFPGVARVQQLCRHIGTRFGNTEPKSRL